MNALMAVMKDGIALSRAETFATNEGFPSSSWWAEDTARFYQRAREEYMRMRSSRFGRTSQLTEGPVASRPVSQK